MDDLFLYYKNKTHDLIRESGQADCQEIAHCSKSGRISHASTVDNLFFMELSARTVSMRMDLIFCESNRKKRLSQMMR
jgi:hypothetical protein